MATNNDPPEPLLASHLHAGLPAPKEGDGTQVAALRILNVPLSDPAISHRSIDTRFRGLFKYFMYYFLWELASLGGAGASRPAFNKIIFIK